MCIKIKNITKCLFILTFILNHLISSSQIHKLSDNAKISIITCGSGNELYSIYGHTAIRISDSETNIDSVYNYGYFDFNTPNFYLKFVKGDMQYFGAIDSFQSFISEYVATNRVVYEQELLITNFQKQKLYNDLNASLLPKNKFYTYKFINKNCTTMVLDKINNIFGHVVVKKIFKNNDSYRTILYQYLGNHFWENLGINIIFGLKVDFMATKIFLPNELFKNLQKTKFKGKKIISKALILNKKNHETNLFSFWNSIYFFCLILILIILLNNNLIFLFYFTVLGFLGIFFLLIGFYSFHHEISLNYNVLLFNPSLLIFNFISKIKKIKWRMNLINFNFISLFLYILIISNKVDFLMLLPLIFTSVIILLKYRNFFLITPIK